MRGRCWETKLQTNERASPLGSCVTSPGLYGGSKTGPDPVRNSAGLIGIQNSLSPALAYICQKQYLVINRFYFKKNSSYIENIE